MKKLILLCVLALSVFSPRAYAQNWNEIIKATASDGAGADNFGNSVSISGDVAIVGAYLDDDAGSASGSAYIFTQSGGVWTEQQKLTASDGAASDNFGYSVSISGDVAIVGAYQDDDAGSASGSAYIFIQSGGVWTEQQKLTASDAAGGDNFGNSVSISGDIAIVGANFDQDNGFASGSAYVFTQSGGVWSQTQKLTASDGAASDNFGNSVSISGDIAIVGAYGDDDNGSGSGSAYIFTQSGGVWTEQQKLTASDGAASDNFGYSASISGDAAIVGACYDDDNGSASGSAYVFTQSGGVWTEQQKLTASDGAAYDNFGNSVSISGDIAIVGALYDDDNGSGSGSAYIFTQSGGVWTEQQKLTASDGATSDQFGYSVSISGDVVIVGACYDDDNGSNSGSAYIFDGPNDNQVTIPASNTASYSFPNAGIRAQFNGAGNDVDLTLNSERMESTPDGNLPVANISPQYWTVTEVSGTVGSGVTYDITLYLAGIPGILNCSTLYVLKRENTGDTWEDITQSPHNGTLVYNCPNSITVTGVASGFSEFAIGGQSDNPLPVELSGFSGISTQNGIQLNWTTQAETDNAGFVIYRNGVEIAGYENTASLKGHGTTSQSHSYAYADADVELNATYIYELVSVDYSGTRHSYSQTVEVKVVDAITSGKPIDYALEQNYPNPFNPSTTITYTMKKAGVASIKVYDMLGRLVFEQTKASVKGENQINFNGSNLTSGMYYYQLNAEGFSKTMKMMLVK